MPRYVDSYLLQFLRRCSGLDPTPSPLKIQFNFYSIITYDFFYGMFQIM